MCIPKQNSLIFLIVFEGIMCFKSDPQGLNGSLVPSVGQTSLLTEMEVFSEQNEKESGRR
ncbi:hypothetical protein INR49_013352 [Caranx melampygus]|nr:hypothetical protein INR49_013352 [Caranx melampygus]